MAQTLNRKKMIKARNLDNDYKELLKPEISTDKNWFINNKVSNCGWNRWHNAAYDKPDSGRFVLLRIEKGGNPDNVKLIEGFYSGYEYCDKNVGITHYDRVTHWRELP